MRYTERSRRLVPFAIAAEGTHAAGAAPEYLQVNLSQLQALLVRRPQRRDVPIDVDEQLVVEHYSR